MDGQVMDSVAGVAPNPLQRQWEGLMRHGLKAEEGGPARGQARAIYARALEIAQALLASPAPGVSADDRVAAFVVTHLKLADLSMAAGQMGDAVAQLCTAHRALMALVRDGAMPATLQLAACRHSRETRTALLEYLATQGAHPDVADTLREDQMLFPWQGPNVH